MLKPKGWGWGVPCLQDTENRYQKNTACVVRELNTGLFPDENPRVTHRLAQCFGDW
ncbi:rCG23229 [Rattus norvegicus]|uniref:RCG23229 n=1 Tax=Rattus norvegicus TaxID=10116 RepID=A6JQ53_RAT|nr:rCG23229 [Rattus norvegicus]